jgi:magnesium chelatase subunit ChlD-like protein
VGGVAAATAGGRRAPRTAPLAKKDLSIRPAAPDGADARPAPGPLAGRHGAHQPGAGGVVDGLATLLRGRPRHAHELVRKPRGARPTELWLVIVDASASTQRHGALSQAKGLLQTLFEQAYRQRVRLAVMEASGIAPRWSWPARKSAAALRQWLEGLGAGGGTPMMAALAEARDWLERRHRSHPAEQRRVVLLTDGRLHEWPALAPLGCRVLLVDIECAPIRLGRARQLAEQLGADYRHIETLDLCAELLPRA